MKPMRTDLKVVLLTAFGVLFFVVVSYLQAAGTLTTSQARGAPIQRLVFDWTADGAGVVNSIVTTTNVNGFIVGVITDPGTPAPTALYDITCLQANGFDVFNGKLVDRSATVTEMVIPGIASTDAAVTTVQPIAVSSVLELRIAAAGAGAKGQVIILLSNTR